MSLIHAILISVVITSFGCTREDPNNKGKVNLGDRLNVKVSDPSASDEKVTYISRFTNLNEAVQHSSEMERLGATVKQLDTDGRILVISAPRSVVAKAMIPVSTSVIKNSPLILQNAAAESRPEISAELESANGPQAFLTARKVTGVTNLRNRFPEADGRNIKVAVFDTGIDFGVEGVEKQKDGSQKLVGFYDLTGFGKVAPSLAVRSGNGVTIAGKNLELADEIASEEILASGILSEKQLAKDYLTSDGIDLNGNNVFDDDFAYVVGRNRDGLAAVWVDINRNWKIDARNTEELTDYNSTFRSLPMSVNQPSGARPLAVSVSTEAGSVKVQFHSVPGGHGTSCAIIIAGDGYADGQLEGMAPKAQLISYLLDTTGQDVYTIDEFLSMFLHAKAQKVDAISISWGFATADLASARFVSEFLDSEIAAHGIVVGIAAGNEGPGISSGLNDDYIPHNGFAVGAYISEEQARNIYGWVGSVNNDVIWYSSVGPSRGGRQVPDVVSPLMTLVRGERGTTGNQYYGFGGTSSATPALIGSISALMSAIKAVSNDQIDVRLLKLAITNSAAQLDGVDHIRTGSGLIDVAKAYDLYLKLFSEMKTARADNSKRTKFPYEVRASTPLDQLAENGEGIHFRAYRPFTTVSLALTTESSKLVDPLVFYEPVLLQTEGTFFEVQELIGLQADPVSFDVRFKPESLSIPGTYTGNIKVVRPSDQIVLATIPIVLEIPAISAENGGIVSINKEFSALEVWRHPVRLNSASAIEMRGVAMDQGQGHNGDLRVIVVAEDGNVVSYKRIAITSAANIIDLKTDTLESGFYEILIHKAFGQPAVLTGLTVNAVVTLPAAELINASFNRNVVQVAAAAKSTLAISSATLVLNKIDTTHQLNIESGHPSLTRQFKAYYGESNLPTVVSTLGVRLLQSVFSQASNPMSNVELVAFDRDSSEILYRGWTSFGRRNNPAEVIQFSLFASDVIWAAWSNIVDWNRQNLDQSIDIVLTTELAFKIELNSTVEKTFTTGQTIGLRFEVPEDLRSELKPGVSGTLTLQDRNGLVLETIDLRL
jgi:hypothetical protein